MDILSANKSMAGGGGGVIIHIIDTGVNPIPELKPVLSVIPFLGGKTKHEGGTSSGGGLSGGNPDPYAAYDYYDRMGHGTMMASIAHRQAPDALIYSYCALPDSVRAYVNEALTYIADHLDKNKKHVVSMSFRGQGALTEGYAAAMHKAIKRLVDMGVACVCASGNDGQSTLDKYPACFEEPFTVAAVDNEGKHAQFSNWPNETDFSEIGVGVPCRDKDGRETVCDGTSPATAVVAGKLACMWSKRPTLAEPALYEAAKKNCIDLGATGRDALYGWGWIAKTDVPGVPRDIPKDPTQDPKKKQENKPVESAPRVLMLTSPRMTGEDVYELEVMLESLGYSCGMTAREKTTKIGTFGTKCDEAVRSFQKAHGLKVDGKVGEDTRNALISALKGVQAVNFDIRKVEPILTRMVGWMYRIGGNGEIYTLSRLEATAKAHPEYYTDGRLEWARAQIELAKRLGVNIYCIDCSGIIMRANEILHFWPEKDLTADSIWKNKTKPIAHGQVGPGCGLFRVVNGVARHMAVVGENGVYEAVGTAYGVVRRDSVEDRITFNLMTGRAKTLDPWTHYGKFI